MKLNNTEQNGKNAESGTTFKDNCLASCQKMLARIAGVKETIFHESFAALKTRERLLRLALNEAEAVAWQTMYPHLVFPTLATEKVQAVMAWDKLQSLRRGSASWGTPSRWAGGVF
jgi:hypothetical protein